MESVMERLKERMKRFMKQGEGVEVGILSGSKWPDGQPIAPIAALHEFGSENMPARPFLRNTLEAKKADWSEYLAENLRNGMEAPQALNMLGEAAALDVQETLETSRGLAPLKDETIMEKAELGFVSQAGKPLVRTGELMKAIGYEVIPRGGE
ncbi:MAG: hypothetical protein LBS31_05075 [Candidatus Adiutrix sp.]|jgi:hypothetical protein|nr:hypothetical protein [Candidatus Adiutrix sp.]